LKESTGDIKMAPDIVETVTGTVTSYVSLPLLIAAFIVTTILFVVAASFFLIFDIFGFAALLLTLFLVFLLIIRVAKVRLAMVIVFVAAIVALTVISIVSDYFGLHFYPVDFYYWPFENVNDLVWGSQ